MNCNDDKEFEKWSHIFAGHETKRDRLAAETTTVFIILGVLLLGIAIWWTEQ